MFTVEQRKGKPKSARRPLPPPRESERPREPLFALKRKFKARGWTYRAAAPELGVAYQYLCEVMNGRRSSFRLTRRIEQLCERSRS